MKETLAASPHKYNPYEVNVGIMVRRKKMEEDKKNKRLQDEEEVLSVKTRQEQVESLIKQYKIRLRKDEEAKRMTLLNDAAAYFNYKNGSLFKKPEPPKDFSYLKPKPVETPKRMTLREYFLNKHSSPHPPSSAISSVKSSIERSRAPSGGQRDIFSSEFNIYKKGGAIFSNN